MDPSQEAQRIAASQYGVISSEQVRRCGLSRRTLRSLLNRGRWVRMHHGVYLDRGTGGGTARGRFLSAAMAAQLALGPAAFASAETAARLWGMQGLPPWDGAVHMTIPGRGSRRRVPGITLHTWATDRGEFTTRGGMRATVPGRTLRDTVLRVDRVTAVCLLDSALNRQLVAADELPGLAAANSDRAGCARSLPWWGMADGRAQSPLETRIRLICGDGGLPPDDLQHPFYDARGHLIAVGDLWWAERRLLVEADGRGPHELPEALLHDRRRQNALAAAHPDVRIVRFTWADLRHPGYILDVVGSAGRQAAGSRQSSS
ncbi:type IV toxin-antitoxin system AbiEi family antitoxin domain-containing protein [Streptomonospora litoralis]|uniref:AbiEi antitoxin N-terminal domain-containing protein n=1 Tax=Streptomonospora litoralis TaxID=2498135 RepID=A0A4P6QAI4_9ACTN|nr:type IV toxin-antitoxin system AbiEi family antitoxin domain-containing protein [Streptomonospora litoralis]QBI56464.1 hypothetical protein EKD16_23585 [Streptomonospora litoralis]